MHRWLMRHRLLKGPRAHQTAPTPFGVGYAKVCGSAPAGTARCNADVATNASGTVRSAARVPTAGYYPADLQSAYSLPSSTAGAGQTVAIVDAYDDPNAESDLAVYRSQFGLPACTTANGCFRKVNQDGGTSYPAANSGWAEEISLDLDMVSAICPNCHILLVEANASSIVNLGTAVDEAAALGANAISNSYGGAESSRRDQLSTQYYDHPGVAITASSGDSGYGDRSTRPPRRTSPRSAAPRLTDDSSVPRGWTETAWSGAGSGCSAVRAASRPGRRNRTPGGAPTARSPTSPPLPTRIPASRSTTPTPGLGLDGLRRHQRRLADHRRLSTRWRGYRQPHLRVLPLCHAAWLNDVTSAATDRAVEARFARLDRVGRPDGPRHADRR